jgi:WD40-like Beta Propeller Repeat
LYDKSAVGLGAEQLLLKRPDFLGVTDWASDGRSILIQDLTHFKLDILPLEGERTATPLLQSEFVEGEGKWSPDRRWIAYTSNESGVWDVYVQPFPALDRKWRISPEGGSQPRWRADGKELYYVGLDQRLMAVTLTADSEFKAGAPAPLFQLRMIPFPPTQLRQQYAVTANGQRFLVNTLVEPPVPAPITIVLNWEAALKRARPTN